MLYGAIFGDIAGSAYEFKPAKSDDFKLLVDKSRYTDDTIMTLAVAKWLMGVRKQNLLVKEMQYFGGRFPRGGYGGMFRKWLTSDDPEPYGSFGNGSAMRVSACAWVASNLEEAERIAKCSAMVTHNHPEGIKGAQSVAAAIFMARNGSSKEDIKNYITEKYDYNLDRTVKEIKDSGYRFNETCQGSVPEAIICFLESTDYEDCIRKAISLKGDSDTQACIAGSIAEAFYGCPDECVEAVKKRLDPFLLNIVKEFNNTYGKEEFFNN